MTFYKRVKNCITLLLALLIVISCSAFKLAYAEDSGIMAELATMSVDGKPFKASDYPAVADGAPQVLNLYECDYSQSGEQERYGLLLYVYNPSQIDVKDDKRNAVQMITGNDEAGRSEKYNLKLLEVSADKLFVKFQVDFTEQQKAYVLSTLDKNGRRYDVNTIELYVSGTNADSFAVERAFTYSGFESTDSLSGTLNYTVEGGKETVPVYVKHTSWRPEGTNGKSEYTQDTLHSVYFAVPNEFDNQYDYLNSVKATWTEARLAPMLITSNKQAYDAVIDLICKNIEKAVLEGSERIPIEFDYSGFKWNFVSAVEPAFGEAKREVFFGSDSWFNYYNKPVVGETRLNDQVRKRINALYLLDYVPDGDLIVSSERVGKIVDITSNTMFNRFENDKAVAGKYPSELFESFSTEPHVEIIKKGEKDKELNLHSEEVKRNLWERIIGSSHAENVKPFGGGEIEAIKEVTSITRDMTTDCNSLYISERDYNDFRDFYDANSSKSTIYLLRFAISEYWRAEVDQGLEGILGIATNQGKGYIAQDNCYLDFDLLDFEYKKNNESYVIPINMSPIDIFTEYTPPPTDVSDFWKYGCAMIGGLIAFYAVYKVAGQVIRGK